jgi:hypothetical protein
LKQLEKRRSQASSERECFLNCVSFDRNEKGCVKTLTPSSKKQDISLEKLPAQHKMPLQALLGYTPFG